MIAVISWIKRYRKDKKVSLICCGNIEGSKKRVGFAELTREQIHQHYENRVELNQDDIAYADYIWQLYCSDSPLRLETVYKFNPSSPFLYLEEALEMHLKRFPSIENGLNFVENYIIDIANTTKPTSKSQLVGNLLRNQKVYGFGDTQYFHKLEK
ncbi:MAG: hypothetical protein JKY02_03995 [Flavobacteriaceae bacterium]|nr:hypothetical protein [Flavobacteriaceae bacterium]